MRDTLVDLVEGSVWGYFAIFGICFSDSLLPVVPGESALFTGAILASEDAMILPLVWVSAWAAGALGDLAAFLIGRRFGPRIRPRLMRRRRMARNVEWAERQLDKRGETVVVVARFIPTGRTATSYSAGALGFPLARFLPAEILAAGLWSAFATAVGYIGGTAFRDSLWKPLVVGTALALVVGAGAEAVRRRRLSD